MTPRRAGAAPPMASALASLCVALVCPSCANPGAQAPSPSRAAAHAEASASRYILSIEPWTFADAEGEIIRTPSYRVFTTAQDRIITDRLPEFLERALDNYRTALGPLPGPPMRLDTYLLNTRPQWVRCTLQLMGAAGRPFLNIARGGFATRGVGVFYDIGPFDTLAVAAHEGWHQYTQRTFRESLPIWIEEGVATYMEGHRWDRATPLFLPWANIERFDQLRGARSRDGLMPLDRLLSTTGEDNLARPTTQGLTYYAQVWALTHFLDEGAGGRYRASLRTLLSDAADGRLGLALSNRFGEEAARNALLARVGPAVFLAYFNSDLNEADREYQAFIDVLVVAGSRDAIVAGRSPVSGAGGAGR